MKTNHNEQRNIYNLDSNAPKLRCQFCFESFGASFEHPLLIHKTKREKNGLLQRLHRKDYL